MSTVLGADGKVRCAWAGGSPEYVAYHDDEWGVPVDDEHRLFEKICLEGFQSGLAWRTILAKRENFRRAFHDFDFERVARFREKDVERLLADPGIVRHRGKIEAAVNNAARARELVKSEGSLGAYFWSFEVRGRVVGPQTVTTTPEAIALSKDLKKRGWKFVGPTTMYAFLQAMGIVNDHAEDCFARKKLERARRAFRRPSRG